MSASLNLPQLEAVHHVQGPCLVLAGAGSGKTRVITHKIAHLIQLGLAPERIAAITFTNKAAAEMRERAKQLVGREAQKVVICTFHALGVRMLRQNGEALGLKKNFSILDTDDVTSILKDAGGSSDLATARKWQWAISLWKNQGLNAAMAEQQASNDHERITARIMARYEERLTAYQSVDFDDLIGLPLKLLQQHEDVRLQWQQQMGHVLVDEYQDTNATQYEMLKLLVGERARFTAVGDDDQSIYGWRGATLDNLQKLPVDFPSLKVVKLEQNYRSTGAILQAANNVIGPNPKLYPKNCSLNSGRVSPCVFPMPTMRNTRPNASCCAFKACEPETISARVCRSGAIGNILRCSTVPTTSRGCWSKRFAKPPFPTRYRADKVFSTEQKFATYALGCVCW